MTRAAGYAPRGERLVEAVPHGHWHAAAFAAGLRADGFVAPLVIDGAVNGELFRAYVEQHLAPALRPGDVVVMDDLGSHKVAGGREAVASAGASVLYLPPYSPDLNPIELTACFRTRTFIAHRLDALYASVRHPALIRG